MKIGKLPESVLIRSVLKQVHHRREDVLAGPSVGVDCAAVAAGENEVFVFSSDPITGTVKDLGSHCIHITANDLAASGAEPVGVMLTFLFPESLEEQELRAIMQDADRTCAEMGMEILGGHTEITACVNAPLISVTGVGKISRDAFLNPADIRPDQDVVVTKWIAIEGTTILAKEREEELLRRFSPEFVQEARDFDRFLSVVKDAQVAVKSGVVAMHDITEGGVFGALWETASAGNVGLEIDLKAIPIRQESVEICEFFDVNPYELMSSGSMLIVTENGEKLVSELRKAGIHSAIVGRTTDSNDRILRNGDEVRYLDKPHTDELYRALARKKEK
uniref:Hydrogenase maturation factor n=1 Tax=Eubacterium cellulosolvens (strain ATCC 43171 / JCM 9499 / 6) TaxID=633697 RepID=I5ARI0_EUBC6